VAQLPRSRWPRLVR